MNGEGKSTGLGTEQKVGEGGAEQVQPTSPSPTISRHLTWTVTEWAGWMVGGWARVGDDGWNWRWWVTGRSGGAGCGVPWVMEGGGGGVWSMAGEGERGRTSGIARGRQ